MILDHIGVVISDLEASKRFYDQCLAPLQITCIIQIEGWAGYGRHDEADFWIGPGGEVQRPMHIAFSADDRDAVDRFYQTALAAGGIDNGAPGIREIYHADYYGAFVFDPDGHNIEAVCHRAP